MIKKTYPKWNMPLPSQVIVYTTWMQIKEENINGTVNSKRNISISEQLEKEHGRLGAITGIVIICIASLAAMAIIGVTTIAWLKVVNWALQHFIGWTL